MNWKLNLSKEAFQVAEQINEGLWLDILLINTVSN